MQREARNPVKDRRLAEAREAKRIATETWHELARQCEQHGLHMRRGTEARYVIWSECPEWSLEVYVGSRQVYAKWPYGALNLPRNWTLCDVVAAVIERLEWDDGNG